MRTDSATEIATYFSHTLCTNIGSRPVLSGRRPEEDRSKQAVVTLRTAHSSYVQFGHHVQQLTARALAKRTDLLYRLHTPTTCFCPVLYGSALRLPAKYAFITPRLYDGWITYFRRPQWTLICARAAVDTPRTMCVCTSTCLLVDATDMLRTLEQQKMLFLIMPAIRACRGTCHNLFRCAAGWLRLPEDVEWRHTKTMRDAKEYEKTATALAMILCHNVHMDIAI